MDGIQISRWQRYGHDRAYATASDGVRLGWIDLKTGVVTIEPGVDAPVVEAQLRAFAAGAATATAQATPLEATSPPPEAARGPVATPPSATPQPQPPSWYDLAAHSPGELVRREADASWARMKTTYGFLAHVVRFFGIHTQERAWRIGAEGEEHIGAKLNKLRDDGWYVLHSVPVGKGDSDIDHLVIGPGGVFTINTKNHPGGKIWLSSGQMRVNGQVVPYVRNARAEAQRASRILSAKLGGGVPVVPCVVVLTGSIVPEVTVRSRPADVHVLDKWDVPKWFRGARAVCAPELVEQIYAVARRSDTWQPSSHA